ncbi:hypothetical protein THAOC_11827, partial [Thalassiosira oceanica]
TSASSRKTSRPAPFKRRAPTRSSLPTSTPTSSAQSADEIGRDSPIPSRSRRLFDARLRLTHGRQGAAQPPPERSAGAARASPGQRFRANALTVPHLFPLGFVANGWQLDASLKQAGDLQTPRPSRGKPAVKPPALSSARAMRAQPAVKTACKILQTPRPP